VISKKVLLAIVCVAILASLCLVGFYVAISRAAYLEGKVESLQETVSSLEDERDSLQNNVSALLSQIDELQEEIAHLQNELSHVNSTRSFSFEFKSWQQTIVNGTLHLNITFNFAEQNMLVKVDDDEYSADWLALFVYNESSSISSLLIYANNWSRTPVHVDENGDVFWLDIRLLPPWSVWWCAFEDGVGYTFRTPLIIDYSTALNTTWLFIFYDAESNDRVSICFHF